jgi:hypothetical protein
MPVMSLYPQDKRAAFLGLILGAISLLIILTTVTLLTKRHFSGAAEASTQTPR